MPDAQVPYQPESPTARVTPVPLPSLTMGKWKASKTIVRESWVILKQDKEIMWFPVLSALSGLLALIIMGALVYFISLDGNIHLLEDQANGQPRAGLYPYLFGYYVVMFFIANFFEAGIYTIVHARFSGKDLTFEDGINSAMENSGKILVWSLISATVGLILQMIADRFKWIGKLVAMLLGAAWNIMTYFSLPSLIIGKRSIEESFKDSASAIRKTWGEAIIINLGVGLFFTALVFLDVALCIGIVILLPDPMIMLLVLVLFIVSIIALAVISSALNSIFKLALYEYATTGQIPQGFSPELIQHAIRSK